MKVRWLVAVGLLALLGVASPFVVRFAHTEIGETSSRPPAVVPSATAFVAVGDRGSPAADREVAASATTGHPVAVLVVDANGDPVAGAIVRHEVRWPHGVQPAVLREVTTDERGLAEAALESRARSGDDVITARSGELYGQSPVAVDDDRVVIRLQRDLTLEIEAVDALGRPRPGLVFYVWAESHSRRFGEAGRDLRTPPTDAAGRVRVEHLQVPLRIEPDLVAGTLRVSYEVHSEAGAALHTFDLRELAAVSTMRIVVPDSGSIAVRPIDATGEVVRDHPSLDSHDEPSLMRPTWREGAWWFDDLPLRQQWTVVARAEGAAETRVPVVGPRTAGEVVRVDIPLGVRRWEFRGTLIRRDGVVVPAGGGFTWRVPELAIHETRRIHHDGGSLPSARAFATSVQRVTRVEITVDSPYAAPAEFTFTGPFEPGEHDLGALLLDPPANEQLLTSIQVRCDGESITNAASIRIVNADGDVLEEMLQQRVSDRIDVLGTVPSVPIFAQCRHGACVDAVVPITIGSRTVVDLPRAAIVRVSIVPPEVPWSHLWATLRAIDEEDASVSTNLDVKSRSFALRSAIAGRHRLTIEVGGRVVHEAEVVMKPGAQEWPADGRPLDLRGTVRARTIVARSAEDPTTFLDASSLMLDAGAPLPTDFEDRTDSAGSYFPRPQPSDLLLRARGRIPMRIANVRGDVDVTLAAMTLVNIENVAGDEATIHLRIAEDAVTDPVLRAFDTHNLHRPEMVVDPVIDASRLFFAPGTVLDIATVRDGNVGPMQRVTVGTASPHTLTVR